MTLLSPFEEARASLGLGTGEVDEAAIKRAYRKAVAEHPPDRDPEVFRRVREAYELLRDPCASARTMLLQPLPQVPPPAPPEVPPPPPRGGIALTLLRLAVMEADPDEWASSSTQGTS
jgi:hypothetical protein